MKVEVDADELCELLSRMDEERDWWRQQAMSLCETFDSRYATIKEVVSNNFRGWDYNCLSWLLEEARSEGHPSSDPLPDAD